MGWWPGRTGSVPADLVENRPRVLGVAAERGGAGGAVGDEKAQPRGILVKPDTGHGGIFVVLSREVFLCRLAGHEFQKRAGLLGIGCGGCHGGGSEVHM